MKYVSVFIITILFMAGMAHAAAEMASEYEIAQIVLKMKSKDGKTRQNAALKLEKLGWEPKNENEKITYFIAGLKFDELERLGEKAVLPLIPFLKDKSLMIRASVAQTLGNLRDKRAVGPLIDALDTPNIYLRNEVNNALKALTGKDFSGDIEKWKEYWEKNWDW